MSDDNPYASPQTEPLDLPAGEWGGRFPRLLAGWGAAGGLPDDRAAAPLCEEQ